MKKITIVLSFILLYSCNITSNNKLDYPTTEKGTVVDNYFGTDVADPLCPLFNFLFLKG